MKEILRKQLKTKRNQLTQDEVKQLSHLIIERIKKTFPLDTYQCIGFYMPFNNEVDLRPLMEELLEKKKTIVLPKVLSKEEMAYFSIESLEDCQESAYHILEPMNHVIFPKQNIDLLLIPGLGFSNTRNRLGYGAGFYDRYLVGFNQPKVGVCYSFQICSFETHEYDIPMDFIITENP